MRTATPNTSFSERKDPLRVRPITVLAMSAIALVMCTGCPVFNSLPAPGFTATEREPATNAEYHFYVPTTYSPSRPMPLLIACHGTRPWDTAPAQLKQWKGLAEKYGFIVAAPELNGTAATLGLDTETQIDRQLVDERIILSVVRNLRASRSIDPVNVYMTGWSAGCYAVLFTGLRHPEVFRALALSQGNFDPELVEPCIPFIDRHQPIQILYGSTDPLRGDAIDCIEWLEQQDLHPIEVERPGFHRRDPEPVATFFFRNVPRHRPYARILKEYSEEDPMRVDFRLKTSFKPIGYRWDFGDEIESTEPSPSHVYREPGLYMVRVAAWRENDRRPHVRSLRVRVPQLTFGEGAANGEE